MNKKPAPAGRKAKPAAQTPMRGLDLASLFNVAAQALAANRSSLNQADSSMANWK